MAGLARIAGGAQWLAGQADKPEGMTINDPRVHAMPWHGTWRPAGHQRHRGPALPHRVDENGKMGKGIHAPFLSGIGRGSTQETRERGGRATALTPRNLETFD